MPEIFCRKLLRGYVMVRNVTPTIEGGLLVSITVILGLLTIYVPLVGIFVEFFFAVPVAVLTARQGADKGLCALFVASVLLSMLIGAPFALRICLSVGLCGVAFGWCVRRNFNAVQIFFVTLMVASAAQIVSIALASLLLDVDIIGVQMNLLRESFDESFNFYESIGVDKTQITQTRALTDSLLNLVAFVIPSLLMFAALVNAVTTYLTSQWIFAKLGVKLPKMPDFAAWRFPSLFFYLAVVGGLCWYWGSTRNWIGIYQIALNLLCVSLIIGFVQGLAILSALSDRLKLSKLVRVLLYTVVILTPFLLQFTAVFGLVDTVFDYRKRFLSDGR